MDQIVFGVTKKSELTEVKYWTINTPITGNIYIFGRIGSGKTCKLLTIVQMLYEKGYKIWDIFGGKRNEGPFWCFKNDDYALWEQMRAETHDFAVSGPKQYKVNILYPMFSQSLPQYLPNNPPNIKSKVFTIPFKEIDYKDISLVLGAIGPTFKSFWEEILRNTTNKDNGSDIEFLMNTKFANYKNRSIYTLFIRPLIENRFLASTNFDMNLDLILESKEKDVITVLCLDYVPKQFHFFVMGYIMKRLINLLVENKIHKRNIAMFREASYFMKVVDSDKTKEDTASIFRSIIVDEIARYARSGVFLAMDTQDSSEVHGLIEGNDDLMGICEMPSPAAREITCLPLKKDRRMNDAQIRYIATMPIHQICVIERGKKAKILKRIQPPRSKYWKSDYGNFYSLWKKEVDLWCNSSNFINTIEEDYSKRDELNSLKLKEYLESKVKKPKGKKNEEVEAEEEFIESPAEEVELPEIHIREDLNSEVNLKLGEENGDTREESFLPESSF